MDQEIIKIGNLSFRYDESDPLVLENINLSIFAGEWVSIVGHNGSGKSTLAKCMNALYVPEDGDVIVDTHSTKREDSHPTIRRHVAMVFQNPDNQFVAPTVEDDVAFGLENSGVENKEMRRIVQESIDRMGLSGLEKLEPHHLSGGQKQRVALAGAIAMRPKVLILDEATSMLDPTGRNEVITYVEKLQREEKMTIISITHDLDEAILSDRVIVMKRGKIVEQGPPQQILSNRELLESTYLKEPFIFHLTRLLGEEGIELPDDIMSKEELVRELCILREEG